MSYLIWSSDEEGLYRSQQPVPIPVNICSAGKLGQIDKDEFLMEEPKPHFLTPKCSSLSPTSTSKDLLSDSCYLDRTIILYKGFANVQIISQTVINRYRGILSEKQDKARCYKNRTSVKSRLVEAAKGDDYTAIEKFKGQNTTKD